MVRLTRCYFGGSFPYSHRSCHLNQLGAFQLMIFVSMFPRTETLLRGFRRELALTAFQVAFNFLFHHLPSIRVWYTHVTCMSSLFFIKITHGALFSSDVSDGYSLDVTPGRTGGGIAGTWLSSSHRGNPFRRGSSARPSIQSPHLPTSPSVRSAPRNADRDATHTRRDIHSVHYYVREYAARSFSNPSDISICQMAYPPPRARRGYAGPSSRSGQVGRCPIFAMSLQMDLFSLRYSVSIDNLG